MVGRDGNYIDSIRGIRTVNKRSVEDCSSGRCWWTRSKKIVSSSRRAVYRFPSLNGEGLCTARTPRAPTSHCGGCHGAGRRRVTTGVGDYGEARLSADNRTWSPRCRRIIDIRSWWVPTTGDTTTRSSCLDASGDDDPAVSPRGNRLGIQLDAQRRPAHLDVAHRWRERARADLWSCDRRASAWSPDATTIAFVSSRGHGSDESGSWPRMAVDSGKW